MSKKLLSMMMISAVSVMSFMSCSNDKSNQQEENGTGTVTYTFGFESIAAKSAVETSTAKPTTGWNDVKQLVLILVNKETKLVDDVREITSIPNDASLTEFTTLIDNVVAGSYEAHLVANYNDSNIATVGDWGPSKKGQNINTFLLNLVKNTDSAAAQAGVNAYKPVSEIFVSKKNVVVVDSGNSEVSFDLTRAVSIFRVRVDQSAEINKKVDFQAVTSSVRIRRVATQYNLATGVNKNTSLVNNLIFSKGCFMNTEPTAANGYDGGKMLSGSLTSWSDQIILPGGHNTVGAEKLDLVIGGIAPVGYTPLGLSEPLTIPTPVYWSGQVQADVTANNILEVNCTLLSAGSIDIPDVGTYGDLAITVNIVEWGNIKSTNIEM